MQDPIFNYTNQNGNTTGVTIMSTLASLLGGAGFPCGFVIDEYDAAAPHGPEIYIHTRSNFGAEAYFSIKLFSNVSNNQQLMQVWANTGYASNRRVDNQPGMFAKTVCAPTNAVSVTSVFSNQWDQSGPNANGADPGKYKTADGTPSTNGSTPTFDTTKPGLWLPGAVGVGNYDVWYLYDQNQGANPATGGSRVLALVWYVGNAMFGVVLGKVLYDTETSKTHGFLLQSFPSVWADRNLTNVLPQATLGGELSTSGADRAAQAIIRNYTMGGTLWPTGTPNGSPLLLCGSVVLSEGRLEAGDYPTMGQRSAHHRPDQTWSESYNARQIDLFPAPRCSIFYDRPNDRRAFCRHRNLSRFPNGGQIDPNAPPLDWRDSGYAFPYYFAPTSGALPAVTSSNGSRRIMMFPGNRGGDENANTWRYAGLGFRVPL